MFRFLITLVLTAVGCGAAPLPTSVIFTTPNMANLKISPDGEKLAFIRFGKGGPELCIYDFATKTTVLASKAAKKVDDANRFDQVVKFYWAPPQTLIVAGYRGKTRPPSLNMDRPLMGEPSTFLTETLPEDVLDSGGGSLSILNCVTGAWVALKGAIEEIGGRMFDQADGVWDFDRAVFPAASPGIAIIPKRQKSSDGTTNLYRVNLASGEITQAGKYAAAAGTWFVHSDGTPRVVARTTGTDLMLYEPEENGKWALVTKVEKDNFGPIGLDEGGRALLGYRLDAAGTEELAAFDLMTRRWGEPLLHEERYNFDGATLQGLNATGPLFSPVSHRFLGMRYFAEKYKTQWFDPKLASLQQMLDKSFPAVSNAILGVSENGARAIGFSWSEREPGCFLLIDIVARKIDPLGWRIPGIKANEMGAASLRQIKARDGTVLDAYLTSPPDGTGKLQPLVIVLRERLYQRNVAAFSPFVQILATRGLAVLQVNHRGMGGYTPDFARQGKDPAHETMHEDIEDATRWAIETGVADPRRIAIVGESFGGFLALYALGHSSDLYACAVAYTPITDWLALSRAKNFSEGRAAFTTHGYMKPGISDEILRARSPKYFVDRIKAPLLFAHNNESVFVPRALAVDFDAALGKAGAKFEAFYYNKRTRDEGSVFAEDQAGLVVDRTVNFLLKYLGPESVPAAK
jgi:dipeptidyl aminopeptidase/acylaminoacyl peptidase